MLINKNCLLTLGLLAMIMSPVSSAQIDNQKTYQKSAQTSAIKDTAIINKERIIYWLVKRGELDKNASEKEKNEALKKYLTGTQINQNNYVDEIDGKPVINFTKHIDSKTKNITSTKNSSVIMMNEKQKTSHEVNVLTLLIDFPDLPHDDNQLTVDDTAMFYNNYNADHYQNLMFSPSGFTGPNDETLTSAHQYYLSESGDSFKFNGKVYGWVTADHDAKHYGGNDENGNDQAATDLVKEALAKAVENYQIDLSEFDLVDPADLDNDGVINEPDGYIDYVMVFHSSIGADAGGGLLGSDAIWAHRWNINNYEIPNTNYNDVRTYRAHGYTIQGIDSAIGVVSHEFGHMVANLRDEYDTNNSIPNSPVGFWSLMSGGSWGGSTIPGSMPTGFSPLAKSQLQNAFGGNWVNSTTFNIDELTQAPKTISIVEAVNHTDGNNLINISLPASGQQVIQPFADDGMFHSSLGDNLQTTMSFDLSLPSADSSILTMKAYWDIEQDWDYAQILVNGNPIAANHTIESNSHTDSYYYMGLIEHYLSGQSSEVNAGWVDLTIDLSQYANQTVTITVTYFTDTNTGGNGLFIDNIQLVSDGNSVIIDDAEGENQVALNGFILSPTFIENKVDSQNYYVQLRSYNGIDQGLEHAAYDHGVLMWFADSSFYNNHSSVHPGQGFISVIDADQNLIKDDTYGIWWTTNQIRDAVFSLYTQREKSADNDLSPISIFNDINEYIDSEQPESGVILPTHGLTMELLEQAQDSSNATLQFSLENLELTAAFNIASLNKTTVSFNNKSFGGESWIEYRWNFGDDSPTSFENNPSYTYNTAGNFTVTLEAKDSSGVISTIEKQISTQGANFSYSKDALNVTFENKSTWGNEQLNYLWDFGDGTQSSEISPQHSYENSGDYHVILKAIAPNGDELTTQQLIEVIQVLPPESNFTIASEFLKVQAISQTTGGAGKLIYTWNFGDGTYQKVGKAPVHIYQQAGTYNVSLNVKDALGRESLSTHSVIVEQQQKKSNGGSLSFIILLFSSLILFNKRKFYQDN